jgi:hypothetical protein
VGKAMQEVRVPGGESMLKHGQVGGVLLLLLEGELQFSGDPHKGHRDAGVWRSAAFGELYAAPPLDPPTRQQSRHARCPRLRAARRRRCTDAILGPGDVVAIGRPGDEGLLAVLYKAAAEKSRQGVLKLMGGSGHRCGMRSLTVRPSVAHRTPAVERSTAYASRGRAAADARGACRASEQEVRFLAVAMGELLHYVGPAPPILASHDGIRAMMLNMPWCKGVTKQELDALGVPLSGAPSSPGSAGSLVRRRALLIRAAC